MQLKEKGREPMNKIHLHFYLMGYRKRELPRLLREVFARSSLHRAWLFGWNGFFSENGQDFGPANPHPGTP